MTLSLVKGKAKVGRFIVSKKLKEKIFFFKEEDEEVESFLEKKFGDEGFEDEVLFGED